MCCHCHCIVLKKIGSNFDKIWVGLHVGRFFFTHPSGHPDATAETPWLPFFSYEASDMNTTNKRKMGLWPQKTIMHQRKVEAGEGWGKPNRVARWQPTKNPILGKFWRVLQREMLVYCVHLVNFPSIWAILWSFGIFSPVLVCCTKKIWQP
jgi:hypothetical protein